MTQAAEKSFTSAIDSLPLKFKDAGFKNFVQSDENLRAYNTCLAFALGKTEKKSIMLTGKTGTGKTHLAIAILKNIPPVLKQFKISQIRGTFQNENKFYDKLERSTGKFFVADEFFQELNDCARNSESKKNLIERYLNENDIILIDELRAQNWSPAKQENLYFIINRAYLNQKRIILTTNFTMEEIAKIDRSIYDRLVEMAIIVSFNGKSFRK